jgi:beta-lactam-binding protein with PASTA domain
MAERDALGQLGKGFLGGLAKLRRGNIRYQEHSDYRPGTVISQHPKPGTLVPKGTAVDLVIARAKT